MVLHIKDNIRYVLANRDNIESMGFCCIKNRKAEGYSGKLAWYTGNSQTDVSNIVALDENNKKMGFIEFMPSEEAWRPVNAKDYFFIQCMAVLSKKDRNLGIASTLLELCFDLAIKSNKAGVCSFASKGVWVHDSSLFVKNGYEIIDSLGRYELVVKKVNKDAPNPSFYNWIDEVKKYKGFHLLYSNQCPWHIKSVEDLRHIADQLNIELNISIISTHKKAQKGPSGFGTFALINNGKLLSDHYISGSRFKNILKQEKII